MRLNRGFLLGVAAFLLLVFAMQWRTPVKFKWNETYSCYDRQPFGCYVFDSVMSASLGESYTVAHTTLAQLDSDSVRRAILFVDHSIYLDSLQCASALSLAHKGCRLVLAAAYFDTFLMDTLGFSSNYHNWLNPRTFISAVQKGADRDTLIWPADKRYPEGRYPLYSLLTPAHVLFTSEYSPRFPVKALSWLKLADGDFRYEETAAYGHLDVDYTLADCALSAFTLSVGRGSVTIVSTPLVFTNYGILDDQLRDYAMRLLSESRGLPMTRIDLSLRKSDSVADSSPFRFVLSQEPLRWALYLALATVLLFLLLSSRRRQRAIPVVNDPENRQLEFVKLIGTLYYQRRDHRDILLRKYTYFADEVRRLTGINVADREQTPRLAALTSLDEKRLLSLLDALEQLSADGEMRPPMRQVRAMIEKMDKILHLIKNRNV